MNSILETLKGLLPGLQKAANEGKINPAEYLIAAALLLMADDLAAMRKMREASLDGRKPANVRPPSTSPSTSKAKS